MNLSGILALAFLVVAVPAQSGQSVNPSGQSSEPLAAKSADTITLPAGSTISVRIADAVNSGKNHSAI